MRYSLLVGVLIPAAALGGCSEGVLDPKGPGAIAEREILFNSLAIMLAIVIPTIIATLGVAYWFRSSNKRATTRLQLQADHAGKYRGLSAQFSGDGFADMRFTVDALPAEQFAPWVAASRCAFHLPSRRSQSVQQHLEFRNAVG